MPSRTGSSLPPREAAQHRSPSTPRPPIFNLKVGSRHWNFYVAVAAGAVASGIVLVIAADLFPAVAVAVFSLTDLILTGRDLPTLTPEALQARAGDEDAPPFIVFLLTIAIIAYAVAALFIALNDRSDNLLRLIAGITSVILAWLMIHVMWGMHYAWEYYGPAARSGHRDQPRGGLKFAGDEPPDGMDFVYFSMLIAMTAQTSDTDVSGRHMRRVVTGQSLFSYLFNTVVIAAAVNIVLSVGG